MFAKLQVALRALTCRPSMRADDQCQAEAGVQKRTQVLLREGSAHRIPGVRTNVGIGLGEGRLGVRGR